MMRIWNIFPSLSHQASKARKLYNNWLMKWGFLCVCSFISNPQQHTLHNNFSSPLVVAVKFFRSHLFRARKWWKISTAVKVEKRGRKENKKDFWSSLVYSSQVCLKINDQFLLCKILKFYLLSKRGNASKNKIRSLIFPISGCL